MNQDTYSVAHFASCDLFYENSCIRPYVCILQLKVHVMQENTTRYFDGKAETSEISSNLWEVSSTLVCFIRSHQNGPSQSKYFTFHPYVVDQSLVMLWSGNRKSVFSFVLLILLNLVLEFWGFLSDFYSDWSWFGVDHDLRRLTCFLEGGSSLDVSAGGAEKERYRCRKRLLLGQWYII